MFGLAALEDALLLLAAAALNNCGRPVPDRVTKYHGEIAVGCCDGNGFLTCHWNPAVPDRTGIPQGMGNPMGERAADVMLRLYRCWPTVLEDGTYPDAEANAAAEGLAQDADCIWSAITRAICEGLLAEYLAGCDGLELVSMTPRRPSGGCAGIEWKLHAHWKPWKPDAP